MATHRSALPLAGVGASVALTAVALLGGSPSVAAVPGNELTLTFEGTNLRANSGGTALDVEEVTNNGGAISSVAGRNGAGTAARFPHFEAVTPPQTVLTVVDRRESDDLDPGSAKFRFGAQFNLDATSEGSPSDDGNNLVQRGLYSAETQYKLQVDDDHPGCRVKGRAGTVSVTSSRAVTPGTWYRVVCIRDGSTVTLVVSRLSDDKRWVYSASGVTGSMHPASRTLPLSVGGKVTSRGTLRADDADQFNGVIDNVFLDII
jgi:hypothetical protein